MKTKWGSCNPDAGSIRLNTELAKKPKECLEYVVVHEMMHLVEPTHNARFVSLMDRTMPNWRTLRDQLNQLPVGHEKWKLLVTPLEEASLVARSIEMLALNALAGCSSEKRTVCWASGARRLASKGDPGVCVLTLLR